MCGSLLIVGCGYVGRPVGQRWLAQGGHVAALSRGGEALGQLNELGIEAIQAHWLESPSRWPLVRSPDAILVSVPHRPDERYQEQTHVAGLSGLLARFPEVGRVVVLSTTGVYHQNDGSWVDEDSAAQPQRIGPQIALAAERWLAQHCPVSRGTALRLAGIYGPGRVPLLAKLQMQEPIPVAAGYLNLIHLDDIVSAIVRLLQQPAASGLYVLSDGHPIERQQFYLDAARILGTPAPQFTQPDPESTRAARSESNKRINPSRILRELEWELRFPTHESGLRNLAQ